MDKKGKTESYPFRDRVDNVNTAGAVLGGFFQGLLCHWLSSLDYNQAAAATSILCDF